MLITAFKTTRPVDSELSTSADRTLHSRCFADAPTSVPLELAKSLSFPSPRACFRYVLMNVALRIPCKGTC